MPYCEEELHGVPWGNFITHLQWSSRTAAPSCSLPVFQKSFFFTEFPLLIVVAQWCWLPEGKAGNPDESFISKSKNPHWSSLGWDSDPWQWVELCLTFGDIHIPPVSLPWPDLHLYRRHGCWFPEEQFSENQPHLLPQQRARNLHKFDKYTKYKFTDTVPMIHHCTGGPPEGKEPSELWEEKTLLVKKYFWDEIFCATSSSTLARFAKIFSKVWNF